MFAFFVQKDADKPGSRPMSAGGITRRLATAVDNEGADRKFNVADYVPGVVLDELQVGEKPQAFSSHGTDEKLKDFQEAILSGVAWGNEIPPEIFFLSFNSNYSASQAAINEYKLYLNPARTRFGNGFCTPIYHDWIYSESLDGRIEAPGLLEAWRSPSQYDVHAAWVSCDWAGNIKPAVDPSKLVKAYDQMVASGYITRDRATRELTGMKYSHVVRRLRIENEQLAEANESLVKLEASAKPAPQPPPADDQDEDPEDVNREDDDDESKGKAQLRVLADSR
jgi:capsid protein